MENAVIVVEEPLNPTENARLSELETIIKTNFLGFVAVGKALAEIRDKRLYRDGNGRTFEGYCAETWEMCRRHAYRIIEAARAVENVTNWSQNNPQVAEIILPQNEAQARELAKLPPEDQPIVWNMVLADGEKVTAKKIRYKAHEHLGKEFKKRVANSTKSLKKARQSEEFIEAWQAFWQQVEVERDANWRKTSKKALLEHIAALTDIIKEAAEKDAREPGCQMTLSDREKLSRAGFRIFRLRAKMGIIEEWHGVNAWMTAVAKDSPAELLDVFNELMDDPKNLRA